MKERNAGELKGHSTEGGAGADGCKIAGIRGQRERWEGVQVEKPASMGEKKQGREGLGQQVGSHLGRGDEFKTGQLLRYQAADEVVADVDMAGVRGTWGAVARSMADRLSSKMVVGPGWEKPSTWRMWR